MITQEKKTSGIELRSLSSITSNGERHDLQDSVSWSNQLNLCCGVMREYMKDTGEYGMKILGGCMLISLVIGLAVGLTWVDNKLDSMCTSNKVINDSGSTIYFEGTLGTLYDGWSIHVDVPKNTTDTYPFSWYNDYFEKENCVLKVRPHSSGKADVEVTDCSPTPNAFDTGVCQWTIKDKYDRRLRGSSTEEEQRDTDTKISSSTWFGFFSQEPQSPPNGPTEYLENTVGMS